MTLLKKKRRHKKIQAFVADSPLALSAMLDMARHDEATRKKREEARKGIRKFSSECWVVGVDTFFLSYSGDWTEKPEFARKFRKPNLADQMVRDTQAANATANPQRHIRLVKVKESFTCIELTPLPGSPSKG